MGREKNRQVSNLQFVKKDAGSSQAMVYVMLMALSLAARLMSPGYLKLTHVAGILRLAPFTGITVIGQNLTVLTGGTDLSIANTIILANAIAARIMIDRNEDLPAALFVVIIMGVMVGSINRVGVHWFKTPPFIMALGAGTVIQGVSLIHTKSVPKSDAPPLLKVICGQSLIGILPGIVVIWAVMVVAIIVPLWNTPYGGRIYPVDINEQAARFSGIHTGGVTFSMYLISVIMAAIPGFSLVGHTDTSFLDVGTSYSIRTIAAVTIGKTAITGGEDGYVGITTRTVTTTILDDFLTTVNIPEIERQTMQGVIVVLLVLVYSREKRKRQTGAQLMESLMKQYRKQPEDNTGSRGNHTC